MKIDELFGKAIFTSWVITAAIYGVLFYVISALAIKSGCPSG